MEKRKRKNVTIFKSGLKMMESQKGSEKTPKIGQTVSLHYNIWLSNESFSSNFYYVGEEGKEKYDDLVSPEYVNEIPEEQLTVTTYGLDIATGIMDKAKIYKITEEELIERDILSCKEVKWLLPQGFKEAILNLEEGSKKIFNIPSELGYGKSGASSFRSFFRYRVPPHSNIKCEIELIKIHSEEEVLEIEESLKQRERLKAEDMQVQDINHNTPN